MTNKQKELVKQIENKKEGVRYYTEEIEKTDSWFLANIYSGRKQNLLEEIAQLRKELELTLEVK